MIKNFLHDVKNRRIFKKCHEWIYIIEYQKRELFHMHILLFLKYRNEFLNFEMIDQIVCAKFSNSKLNKNENL